ncbi:MAG: hypothetical protein J5J06_15880 [Phycisphaerae bacterium]|nr:hypothetical protein [Phycisphaerae bacterium]
MKNQAREAIRIVVYVDGGIVQDVLSDTAGVQVMIVDYDNERAGDPKSSRSFESVTVDESMIERTVNGTEG